MKVGKIIAIIGAVIGLASIILSFIVPELFSWYRYEVSGMGTSGGWYLTGFGTVTDIGNTSTMEISILVNLLELSKIILIYRYNWGLWIGFFLGISAGVIGLIGGLAI